MPDAIPSGDKVVGVRRRPRADIGVVEYNVRMPQPSEPQHLRRQIQPFDVKTLANQQFNKATATAASNVKCLSVTLDELKRTPVLSDAVGTIEFGAGPSLS
jgi:hypothetical protein